MWVRLAGVVLQCTLVGLDRLPQQTGVLLEVAGETKRGPQIIAGIRILERQSGLGELLQRRAISVGRLLEFGYVGGALSKRLQYGAELILDARPIEWNDLAR